MPIERGGKYTLEFGDVVLTVDPAVGARVTTFALKGKNLLTDSAADMSAPEKNNWGSTFWPSPQTEKSWGGMSWPPIPEIDSQAYTAKVDGTSIEMKSAVSVRGKMSLVKRFTPVLNAQAVDQTFTLKNEDSANSMSWAAWQITRVAMNGLTFFPTGTKVVDVATDPLDKALITNMAGVSWYKNKPADFGKYVADGAEGWIGHVSGNVLFVKKFADTPEAMLAPNEGDAEIYAGKGYVEIEPQGPYTTLPPGMSLTWTVRWYVRELADPSMATVGNAALVQLVRDVVEQ
jgi:hypothetical protein